MNKRKRKLRENTSQHGEVKCCGEDGENKKSLKEPKKINKEQSKPRCCKENKQRINQNPGAEFPKLKYPDKNSQEKKLRNRKGKRINK